MYMFSLGILVVTLKVADKLAQEAPGLMRAQELHARALVAVALHPDMATDDRAVFLGRAAMGADWMAIDVLEDVVEFMFSEI